MTIYSIETHAGIWHANFQSVAHLHWKKRKRWEAFWSLLKIELRGMNSYHWAQGIIDFLHNGSQVLHLTPQIGGGWKCTPRCSYYFKYLHSQPLPQRKAVHPGRVQGVGLHPVVGVCSRRHLLLGIPIFSGQEPKAPLFQPGSQGEGRAQGKPTMKHILTL